MSDSIELADAIRGFSLIRGAHLHRVWNVFGTYYFYFRHDPADSEREAYLMIECPWRIEQEDHLITGLSDYSSPAKSGLSATWEPGSQTGHLLEERLIGLLGPVANGEIQNHSGSFQVGTTEIDQWGGVRIQLSPDYCLALFPNSSSDMEWMLSHPQYLVSLQDQTLKARWRAD